MAVEFINHKDLENKLNKEGITIVNVYADWCGPCKMLAPILEEISNDHKVLKINADENQEFLVANNIKGIPTTFIFKNGKQVKTFGGFVPKKVIESEL